MTDFIVPPASFLRVKNEVKEITGCTHKESTTITMMLEAKMLVDSEDTKAALNSLLALIIRAYRIPAISDADDLVKLLNTGGKEYDSLRIFMTGIEEGGWHES